MLAKIIQWSGRNPFLILLATLFVVIGGVVALIVSETAFEGAFDLWLRHLLRVREPRSATSSVGRSCYPCHLGKVRSL